MEVGNMTEDQATESILDQLEEELSMMDFMNRASIPLGLTGLIEPRKNTSNWKLISAKEQRWYDITAKTWTARWARTEGEASNIK